MMSNDVDKPVAVARLTAGNQFLLRAQVLRRTFPDGTRIAHMGIVRADEQVYLVRVGLSGSREVIVSGVPLEQNGREFTLGAKAGKVELHHTCSGQNCSWCEFRFDDKGNITGCHPCSEASGQPASCNHTVKAVPVSEILTTEGIG
jgi:hypothetical protein